MEAAYSLVLGLKEQLEYVYPDRPNMDALKAFAFPKLKLSVSVQCGKRYRSKFLSDCKNKVVAVTYPLWSEKIVLASVEHNDVNRRALPFSHAVAFEAIIMLNGDPCTPLTVSMAKKYLADISSKHDEKTRQSLDTLFKQMDKFWIAYGYQAPTPVPCSTTIGSYVPTIILELFLQYLAAVEQTL